MELFLLEDPPTPFKDFKIGIDDLNQSLNTFIVVISKSDCFHFLKVGMGVKGVKCRV